MLPRYRNDFFAAQNCFCSTEIISAVKKLILQSRIDSAVQRLAPQYRNWYCNTEIVSAVRNLLLESKIDSAIQMAHPRPLKYETDHETAMKPV
jgi:hypothetical protein